MTITNIPLSKLKPNSRNIRIHSEKQIEEYKRSLQKNGQLKPIVCDEDGVIWIGNGLYEAMKSLGLKEAACFVKSGMTENEKLKMMMADNKVYELGLTDHESIDSILKDLNGDFDIPGYDDSLLEMLTMSYQETDDFVNSYGTFESEDVDKIRKKEEAAAEKPAPDSVSAAAQAGADPEAETGKYVICPKCGERICLS